MRQEESEKEDKPENSSSNLQKLATFFSTVFCGAEPNPIINRSIAFNTYTQVRMGPTDGRSPNCSISSRCTRGSTRPTTPPTMRCRPVSQGSASSSA